MFIANVDSRATPQWFANIESIKQSAIDAMETVNFKPEQCKLDIL